MCSLIASPRHKPEDLEHWRSLQLQDQLYAMRHEKRLERMADKAKEAIAQFLEQGDAYCSVSWGKDSTLTAYLVYQIASSTPLVSVWANRANPDNALVRDAFLGLFPMRYDQIEVILNDDDQGESASETAAFFKPAQQNYGDRRIIGIRADESASRRMQMFQHGENTLNVCRPIIRWTLQDVFAYSYLHGLPLHPVYAMSNGGLFPRDRLRVDVLGDRKGNQFGRSEWEEMYYRQELWQFKSSTTQN